MNQQDKIELSKRIAEKLGIDAWVDITPDREAHTLLWLADDNARCFELMVKYGLEVYIYETFVTVYGRNKSDEGADPYAEEYYKDHTSPEEATRIAILKCLENME